MNLNQNEELSELITDPVERIDQESLNEEEINISKKGRKAIPE